MSNGEEKEWRTLFLSIAACRFSENLDRLVSISSGRADLGFTHTRHRNGRIYDERTNERTALIRLSMAGPFSTKKKKKRFSHGLRGRNARCVNPFKGRAGGADPDRPTAPLLRPADESPKQSEQHYRGLIGFLPPRIYTSQIFRYVLSLFSFCFFCCCCFLISSSFVCVCVCECTAAVAVGDIVLLLLFFFSFHRP